MKALLICPADRPAVSRLAEATPLAVAPLLGKTLVEYWIEALASRGAKHVQVLASDRPNDVRAVVGDGSRWGVKAEVVPQSRELAIVEARAKYRTGPASDWLPENEIVVMDYLPGAADFPLFESYAGWFAALCAWMPRALTPARVGAREVQPGVWVGLHAQIAPTAQLRAPCWIGEYALVGPGAVVGPNAIIEDRVIVESRARVERSVVGPETFVGELICVLHSLAHGSTVINWGTGSCLQVPDPFFLSSLDGRRFAALRPGVVARATALAAMLASAPFAVAVMGLSLLRGDNPLLLRLGVRPQRHVRTPSLQTFAYYELTGARNWLRRWPQFWSVVCGDLTWVGNRPLRPTQALALANDFERLWLTAPVGLVSLADAQGCPEELNHEACAHASYYAVNAGPRLDWRILGRALLRAANAWPLRWPRRKEHAVPLPRLVPNKEG